MTLDRLPPGQHWRRDFPVLTFGSTPKVNLATWRLRLWGEVEAELSLSFAELLARPQITLVADFHCVTTWSRPGNRWEGVSFAELCRLLRPKDGVHFAMVYCVGGYITNLPLETLLDDDVLLAHHLDGAPLTPEHGWPLRLVVPKRYAWKSAKWVSGIEFMAQDRLGFWEEAGYHPHGDPWKEERYASWRGENPPRRR